MVMVDREKMSKSPENSSPCAMRQTTTRKPRHSRRRAISQPVELQRREPEAGACGAGSVSTLRCAAQYKTVAPAGGEAFEVRFIEAMDDDFIPKPIPYCLIWRVK
ncbi:hypothetical protein ACLK19_03530 [Escherichia coli]